MSIMVSNTKSTPMSVFSIGFRVNCTVEPPAGQTRARGWKGAPPKSPAECRVGGGRRRLGEVVEASRSKRRLGRGQGGNAMSAKGLRGLLAGRRERGLVRRSPGRSPRSAQPAGGRLPGASSLAGPAPPLPWRRPSRRASGESAAASGAPRRGEPSAATADARMVSAGASAGSARSRGRRRPRCCSGRSHRSDRG